MSTPANVQSTDAILAVRASLAAFAGRVRDALTELESEMRRMQEWLDHDRPRYWRHQMRLAVDAEHEAKQALHRCLMFPVADERPSCYEERLNLKKAQARLRYCEEKIERVRYWQQEVQHEFFEYHGRMTQLVQLAEIDMPQAVAVLDRIVRSVEEYQQLRTRDPSAAYRDESVAREVLPAGEEPGAGTPRLAEGDEAGANGGEEAGTREVLPEEKGEDQNPLPLGEGRVREHALSDVHPHPGPLPEGEGETEGSDA